MTTADVPCRAYVVYQHGLFAQGLRSVLERRRAVHIVGMESDVTKVLKAVQSLRPEVIIVEESSRKHQRMRLGAFLNGPGTSRVVALSLDHSFATVYERHRVVAKNPGDLIKVIRGGQQQIPGPDPPDQTASMLYEPTTRANGNSRSTGPKKHSARNARTERRVRGTG